MQTIVLSAGRSGTNLILECMTGHSYFISTERVEDQDLFSRDTIYPDRYLTKCDVIYIPSRADFHKFMDKNKSAYILWALRHPYDWVLSKLYRGRVGPADDATINGCKLNMYVMYEVLKAAELHYPSRILRVRMEDIILNIEEECKRICKFLNVPYEEEMCTPHLRMRHKGKKERYGNKLDTSQVNLYKNIDTVYNGYFIDKKKKIDELFKYIHPLVKEFNY